MSLLKGVAFITGAGSGIGQYTAFALARHGVKHFALTDINRDGLKDTQDQLKKSDSDISTIESTLDVRDEAAVTDAVSATVSKFGRLDFAVNSAGVASQASKPTPETPADDWSRVVDINLKGVWLCQKAQLQQMLKQEHRGLRFGRGSIVNVASMYGVVGPGANINSNSYAAAKHGVLGVTKTDAVKYAAEGVRINAICPGYVKTPLLLRAMGMLQAEVDKTPMGRFAEMEEIGDAVAFMLSPLSSFMTGSAMVVDGGFTAQ